MGEYAIGGQKLSRVLTKIEDKYLPLLQILSKFNQKRGLLKIPIHLQSVFFILVVSSCSGLPNFSCDSDDGGWVGRPT